MGTIMEILRCIGNHPSIILEFIGCGLLILGFAYEEKVIAFEQNLKRIIVGNYRRAKRLRKAKKSKKG